ncbi:MAG: ribonuclease P protein component [Pyramidobacter sp.]
MPKAASVWRSNRRALVFSYPASLRLKQGWEYDTLFRTGSRLKGRLVRLLFVKAPDGKTRFAMAVGKKLAKAHLRNRGRRMLKESVRRLYPWIREGWWFALMLTEQGLNAKAAEVYADLGAVLKKRGLMKNDWPGPAWYQ